MFTIRDAFSPKFWNPVTMADVIADTPYIPSYLRDKDTFEERNIPTIDVALEQVSGTVNLVQTSTRGGPSPQRPKNKRAAVKIATAKISEESSITIDEIRAVIAAGGNVIESLETVRNQHIADLDNDVSFTEEHMLLGAIQGLVLDADGSVLFDLNQILGIEKPADVGFSKGAEAIKKNSNKIRRTMAAALGVNGSSGFRIEALCGDEFYDWAMDTDEVKKAFDRPGEGGFLREGGLAHNSFMYAGIIWTNYAGHGEVAVPTSEARFYADIPGIGKKFYSPSDRAESLGGVGQERYAFADIPYKRKSVELEVQANIVPIYTKPGALITGKLGN